MADIRDKDVNLSQYNDSSKLDIRIAFHQKYSTNKQGVNNWIFSNYSIKYGMHILELGCGSGITWKDNLNKIDNSVEITLTDYSEGMLEKAKSLLASFEKFRFDVVDIQNIPYEDNSFDIVIANMMLYHVPNLDKAFCEVKRVLKKDGTFYCATFGENGLDEGLAKMLGTEAASNESIHTFTLQNGAKKLDNHFNYVEKLIYDDSLEVTDMDDLIEYIHSLKGMSDICKLSDNEIINKLLPVTINGVLRLPKEYGLFICKGTECMLNDGSKTQDKSGWRNA